MDYKTAGVDVKLGDQASKILYQAAQKTWANRKGLGKIFSPNKTFSGVRVIDVSQMPKNTVLCMGFDGIGTKVEIAQRLNMHNTMAYDLLAMTCDDAVMAGGEPVLAGSVLDVNSLAGNMDAIKQLASGYVKAAREAGVAIINGELAELGAHIGGYGRFHYAWSSTVVWFGRKDRLFDGRKIRKGDYLVGLKENGFRSNGLSLVRKVLKNNNHRTIWEKVSTPSKIYTKAAVAMFGGYDKKPQAKVHGIAHITGGGIPGKLGRVLKPSGLGAIINDPFEPPEIMKYCQKIGKVTEKEAYSAWNMGQGMVIITPEPDKVINIALKNKIKAKVIGEVVHKSGITINSTRF
ncbi:MAG: AIR synthase-related protein [Patescibacteria group bacterium]|jgi:phosphoribosylformylglycinamidine cyclo-ligase